MVADQLNTSMEKSRSPALEAARQTSAILDCLEIRVYSLVSHLRHGGEAEIGHEPTPEEILRER